MSIIKEVMDWTDGRTDRQTDRRTGVQTDGQVQTNIPPIPAQRMMNSTKLNKKSKNKVRDVFPMKLRNFQYSQYIHR